MRARARATALLVLLAGVIAALVGTSLPVPAEADGPRRGSQAQRERRRVEARRQKRARVAKQRRRGRETRAKLSPVYRRRRERWHQAAPREAVRRWLERDPPPLVLAPAGSAERFVLDPETDEGGFDATDVANAGRAFAIHRGATVTAVPCEPEPRLLELLYDAVRHFRAPWVTLVSGYRVTRSTSRHSQCRAIDMVLPGVRDERLAAYLRRAGFVGVGVYPVSGFVHLDVRTRSYFWIDRSGPGEETRVREVMEPLARRMDRDARRRGVVPGITESATATETDSDSDSDSGSASVSVSVSASASGSTSTSTSVTVTERR